MIAFASLILGLVAGVVPVSVIVTDPVVALEIELDGGRVGRRDAPPWTITVDFGSRFEPHELIAKGFDRNGNEVSRVRQWVNLPRPPAEVEIVPERGVEGRVTAARLVWQSVLGPSPTAIRVTFDRRPLSLEGNRVLLPQFDAASTHILSAELEFPLNIRSRQDLVLGGGSAGDAKSELTAVPVRVTRGRLPGAEAMHSWLWKNRDPLTVTAVEHGSADVVIVREVTTQEAFKQLQRPPAGSFAGSAGIGDSRFELRLAGDDRAQIVWPIARRYRASGMHESLSDLFERSRVFLPKEAGIHWLLTNVYDPVSGDPPRRFADAVAIAGLHAFSGYSRRAVVLVLSSGVPDRSLFTPEEVREYLGEIHVPLRVWSLTKPDPRTSSPWGRVEDVSSYWKLRGAVSRLKEDLAQQSILWVEGRHLPQHIRLSENVKGVEVVK